MSLTPKQKKILDFVTQFQEFNGFAPSQKEIAEKFGFRSLGTVQNYLVRLERYGFLKKDWNQKRGIRINPINKSRNSVELPVLGRVAAGKPIEAIDFEKTLEVPRSMIKGQDLSRYYILKISGQSMVDEGILDGDYVLIKKQASAENGQTIIALIDNQATIKKYYLYKSKIELRPANSAYSPIIVRRDSETNEQVDFKIEGIFSGLIRYPE